MPEGADPPLDGSPPRVPDENALLPYSERKVIVFAVIVVACLAVVYLSPLRHYLTHLQEISQKIRAMGLLGPVVLVASVAVLVSVGFPRLLFCFIAGMTFGFWRGLVLAQLGTLIGNYAVFMAARYGGRDWAENWLKRRQRMRGFLRQNSISGVILARQLPVPGFVVNLTFGLLPIRQRDFCLGTIVGQLPQAVPCTLMGAGALKGSFAHSAGLIGLAVIVMMLLWIGIQWLLRRQKGPDTGPLTTS